MNSCIKYCTSEPRQDRSRWRKTARASSHTGRSGPCATCVRIWRVRTLLRSVMSWLRTWVLLWWYVCQFAGLLTFISFRWHRIGDSRRPSGLTAAHKTTQNENFFYFYSSHDLKQKILVTARVNKTHSILRFNCVRFASAAVARHSQRDCSQSVLFSGPVLLRFFFCRFLRKSQSAVFSFSAYRVWSLWWFRAMIIIGGQ